MQTIKTNIDALNWQTIANELNEKGFARIPKFITDEQCERLIENYDDPCAYRKTVAMERYRFGLGEYKYFNYPLPGLIQNMREALYPKLAPIANLWMKVLSIDTVFPDTFSELQTLCHANGQLKPTVLILKYGKGGYNTLHQDLYGDIFFPIQTVLFLNEPGKDYSGGEFVLTEQIPRLNLKQLY